MHKCVVKSKYSILTLLFVWDNVSVLFDCSGTSLGHNDGGLWIYLPIAGSQETHHQVRCITLSLSGNINESLTNSENFRTGFLFIISVFDNSINKIKVVRYSFTDTIFLACTAVASGGHWLRSVLTLLLLVGLFVF